MSMDETIDERQLADLLRVFDCEDALVSCLSFSFEICFLGVLEIGA